MGQRGAVLVSPPHVLRDVQVQAGVEVDLVVRPLVLAAGAGPGPVQDGDQVALGEASPGEESLPGRLGGGEPHLHPPVLQTVRLQGGERYPVLWLVISNYNYTNTIKEKARTVLIQTKWARALQNANI